MVRNNDIKQFQIYLIPTLPTSITKSYVSTGGTHPEATLIDGSHHTLDILNSHGTGGLVNKVQEAACKEQELASEE